MTIIPTACGVVIYRMFQVVSSAAVADSTLAMEDILTLYIDVIDRLIADKQMILTIAVFFIIILAIVDPLHFHTYF